VFVHLNKVFGFSQVVLALYDLFISLCYWLPKINYKVQDAGRWYVLYLFDVKLQISFPTSFTLFKTSTVCTVTSDAQREFDALLNSLSTSNSTAALICMSPNRLPLLCLLLLVKCVKGPNQVVVDQVKQGAKPEDLEEEMPGVNRHA